jgi:hypothetical protein
VIAGSLVYATLRYPVFGGVDWIHFPLYVTNKVFALSGFIMLMITSILSLNRQRLQGWFLELHAERNLLGAGSLVLIIFHVFMSVVILSPEYYDKFFASDGKMNLKGEFSMFFGVAGLAVMWLINRYFSLSGEFDPTRKSRKQFKKLISLAIFTGFLHTLIMGFQSWMTPWEWYGYMPPISLVASFGFLVWFIFFLIREKPVT